MNKQCESSAEQKTNPQNKKSKMVIDIKNYINQIIQGDCLEVMKDIPDKSINLIITDPPYNIGKAKWDKINNYIEWMGTVFLECQRVLKDNGSFYFFHNDFEQMAELQHWIKKNTRFIFNSFIVWDKGDFRALSWKNPSVLVSILTLPPNLCFPPLVRIE